MKRILNWFKKKQPTLQIVKETKIDGTVNYFAYYDGVCQKAFYTQKEAEDWALKVVQISAMGYPKKEIIKDIDI
jgi:hypothetical protein